jgi:hypothetical protein
LSANPITRRSKQSQNSGDRRGREREGREHSHNYFAGSPSFKACCDEGDEEDYAERREHSNPYLIGAKHRPQRG